VFIQYTRWLATFAGDALTDVLLAGFAGNVVFRTNAKLAKQLIWYIPFFVRLWYVLTVQAAELSASSSIRRPDRFPVYQ
jgi:hypothetical protein